MLHSIALLVSAVTRNGQSDLWNAFVACIAVSFALSSIIFVVLVKIGREREESLHEWNKMVSMDAWIIKLLAEVSFEFLEAVNAELIPCRYAPGDSNGAVPQHEQWKTAHPHCSHRMSHVLPSPYSSQRELVALISYAARLLARGPNLSTGRARSGPAPLDERGCHSCSSEVPDSSPSGQTVCSQLTRVCPCLFRCKIDPIRRLPLFLLRAFSY